jgi:RimJ/RimL family protein N-acetyltransferase
VTPYSAPILETERLRLRGHTLLDFEPMLVMWTDPEVTRFVGGKPSTRDEVWSRLLRYIGHWAALGYGYWAVEERASGAFIGDIGIADFQRDLDPPLDGVPEVGWSLTPAAHGKGYATEAVKAAVEWGDNHFVSPRMVCMISPENAASIRVAEKCGFRRYAEVIYKNRPNLLFERV